MGRRGVVGLGVLALCVLCVARTPAAAAPAGQGARAAGTPTAVSTTVAVPTAAPTQTAPGAGSGIYYDDGREIFEVGLDGSGLAALAVLPQGNDFVPRAAGGRLLYFDGHYWLALPDGERLPVTPPLGAGESVFGAWPSPDGSHIAWQLYAPSEYTGLVTNLGTSRVVVTDAAGNGARTIMVQPGGSTYGDLAELVGWRVSGVPMVPQQGIVGTLLVQTRVAAQGDGTMVRGLQELDPSIGDLVNDFLPPVTSDLPTALTLDVSADGQLAAYAPNQARLPSGEGPLPTTLAVLDLTTLRSVVLDDRSHYPGAPDARHALTRYPFFSQRAGAPIAPDDAHVLYTLVTVTYPTGAMVPHLDETAEVASLITHHHAQLAAGARAVGWLDSATAIVRKADGLYTVDLTTKRQHLIVKGHNLRFLGLRG